MMTKKTYVIVSDRPWNQDLHRQLEQQCTGRFVLINKRSDLTPARLADLSPRYIFFPHWSHKISSSIHENFECVVFHMTDVPYGRGGSPLQNLITHGHTETVLSALRCIEEMDAGPVYLKRNLCLHGAAEEIFIRASEIIKGMIKEITETEPEPYSQVGTPTVFRRRGPRDGNIVHSSNMQELYDLIRMLDAPGYPPAYLEFGDFCLEFRRASLRSEGVHADVIVRKVK